MTRQAKLLALAALPLLALPLLPVVNDYFLHVIVLIFVYMILAMGLNIVPGFTGLLNLGYVGFFGIGAYTAGILTVNFGLSFWTVAPIAAVVGALSGLLLGAPTLRLTGDYFAIVTFGFSEMVVLFLTNEIWLTRGPLGMPGIDPVTIDLTWLSTAINPAWDWFYEFTGEVPYYYLALLLTLFVYLIIRRMEDSRLGRAWLAIREDALAASCAGVDLFVYKLLAFMVSAAIGALAGAFFARWSLFLTPDMFKFWESFLVLCMIVLGGLGSIAGSMLGAVIFIALGEGLRVLLPVLSLPPETRFLAYGLIMILIMRFKPGGFFSGFAAAPEPAGDEAMQTARKGA